MNCWATRGSICNLIQERDFKKSKIGARCFIIPGIVSTDLPNSLPLKMIQGMTSFIFIKKHSFTDCLFMVFHHNYNVYVSVKLKNNALRVAQTREIS